MREAALDRNLELGAAGRQLSFLTNDHKPAMRPLIKWAGGKRSLMPQLLPLAPETFSRYVEPFLGGASFFLTVAPKTALLADANSELIGMYSAVRDLPHAVMAALDNLSLHVGDGLEYYRIRSQSPAHLQPAERAARFIYLNKTGFNGLYRVNRKGEFNVPFGTQASPPRLYDRHNLMAVSAALAYADLRCQDFESVIDECGPGDFVYLDPPYDPLTTTASFTRYTSDAFTSMDQERLAASVRRAVARGVRLLISNSATDRVIKLYSGFNIHMVSAHRRINSDGTKRAPVAEVVIQAFP